MAQFALIMPGSSPSLYHHTDQRVLLSGSEGPPLSLLGLIRRDLVG
jgi:hypothetical protein